MFKRFRSVLIIKFINASKFRIIFSILFFLYPFIGLLLFNEFSIGYLVTGIMIAFTILSFVLTYIRLNQLSKLIKLKDNVNSIRALILTFLSDIWIHYKVILVILTGLLFSLIWIIMNKDINTMWLSLAIWLIYCLSTLYDDVINYSIGLYDDYEKNEKEIQDLL